MISCRGLVEKHDCVNRPGTFHLPLVSTVYNHTRITCRKSARFVFVIFWELLENHLNTRVSVTHVKRYTFFLVFSRFFHRAINVPDLWHRNELLI